MNGQLFIISIKAQNDVTININIVFPSAHVVRVSREKHVSRVTMEKVMCHNGSDVIMDPLSSTAEVSQLRAVIHHAMSQRKPEPLQSHSSANAKLQPPSPDHNPA